MEERLFGDVMNVATVTCYRMMVRRKTTTVKVRRKQKRTAKGEVREYEKDYTEAGYSLIVANDRNEHFIP
jgi:hypothetical protein